MAFLHLPRRVYQVPERITRINYASPFADALEVSLPIFGADPWKDIHSSETWEIGANTAQKDRRFKPMPGLGVMSMDGFLGSIGGMKLTGSLIANRWPNSVGTAASWVWRKNVSSNRQSFWSTGSNLNSFYVYNGGVWYDNSFVTARVTGISPKAPPDRPVLVAAQYDGTNHNYFEDGELAKATAATWGAPGSTVYYGYSGNTAGIANTYSAGLLMWSRVLPPSELRALAGPHRWDIYDTKGITYFIPAAAGGSTVNAKVGAISLTGAAASINAETNISAKVGAISLTGAAASINIGTNISAKVGAISLTGAAASINIGTNISAKVGAISLAGAAASINAETNISAKVGAISLAGAAASINVGTNISAKVGAISLTGAATVIAFDRTITAKLSNVTLSGYKTTLSGNEAYLFVNPTAVINSFNNVRRLT